MKYKYIVLIITSLIIGLTACKKDSNKNAIVGKWHETKLRMYEQDDSGAFLYDTTFLQPFTSADFIQFNNNNTCIIGNDYYYYADQDGQKIPPQKIPATTSTLNYTTMGAKFVLSSQSNLTNPGGFDVRDTVSTINLNTLLFRSVFYPHQPGLVVITDAYYTR